MAKLTALETGSVFEEKIPFSIQQAPQILTAEEFSRSDADEFRTELRPWIFSWCTCTRKRTRVPHRDRRRFSRLGRIVADAVAFEQRSIAMRTHKVRGVSLNGLRARWSRCRRKGKLQDVSRRQQLRRRASLVFFPGGKARNGAETPATFPASQLPSSQR